MAWGEANEPEHGSLGSRRCAACTTQAVAFALDLEALDVAQGEIAAFHGTRCHHRAPPNESSCARVSLDFRVGVGPYFDPRWRLPGAKAQHTRREVTLPSLPSY